jgi:hypothetical protein
MSSSPIALARAAALATLLVMPTAFAFAADNSAQQTGTQQTVSPAARQQQAQVPSTNAAPATNGNDANGDDPYVTASRHEKFNAGRQAPTGFSNEPNWNSPEYTSH